MIKAAIRVRPGVRGVGGKSKNRVGVGGNRARLTGRSMVVSSKHIGSEKGW